MSETTHTLPFGDYELTTYNDGRFVLPAAYFANVPEGIIGSETVEIGANLWVLRGHDKVILVDTGSGEALKARFPETGAAWGALQDVHPTDIVISHMHADHIGGFADPNAFAGATIHIARTEWEFWTNPALVDAVPEDNRPMIQMIQSVAAGIADRVALHDADAELAPNLQLAPLPGHTPGHSGLRVQNGSESLLIIADAVISQDIQCANPGVSYALDGDAAQAIATRRALLADCAAKGTMIAATHFAFPGLGTIEAAGDAFQFKPA